ncbi:IS66 family insertion sequence element accessory protein TnpB [Vibrio rarus]|uniref:IS66 family insertion sequence element accessory protein TnpB n=1 Tax=Vibrio rarus TaxID=413403 RepID=UPI0021C2A42F|nr:IS66 family insertion sequence element accessory protein TnpB [Vibrio rarus]
MEPSESSSLSRLAFCKHNERNPSTFYAKRQQLNKTDASQGFVRAEVIVNRTKYQAQIATANRALLVNVVELSISQGTPAAYLAEFMGALSLKVCSAPQRFPYMEKASI